MLLGVVIGLLYGSLIPALPAAAAHSLERVTLIGIPGLMWSDLNPADTPNLWRLAGQSATGSLSVKTVGRVTCPYDGWLTVSAGVRSAVGRGCGLPPAPLRQGEGAVVADVPRLREAQDQKYVGTLGEAAHAGRQCTTAVGPGAALALADRQGWVDVYADSPADVTDWTRCKITAVAIDDLVTPYLREGRIGTAPEPLTPRARQAAVRAADARLTAILPRLGDGLVLVVGLADHGSVPHLRVAMLHGQGTAGSLGARSTHRTDMIIVPDLTATILTWAVGAVPSTVVGVPVETHDMGSGEVAARVAELRTADVAGQTIRDTTGVFFTSLAVLQVLFYVVAFLLLRRRELLPLVQGAAIALASVPVSTYLVNLFPWTGTAQPTFALVAGILATATVLTVVALAGPWRRSIPGSATVIAAVTAAVLICDLLTGTPLQFNSLMGYTGVVGARYSGLGNIPFALLATSVLLVTTAIADLLARSGRRTVGAVLVASLGGFAMLLGGWPGVGSDFGGVIAFVPGIAVATLLVAGKRVSIVKLGAFCAAGGVLVMIIAYLDHLRPIDKQSHLGRFAGQVADGTFLPVISRKLTAMLSTLISPNLMPVVIVALAFLVFALLRPGAASAGILPAAFERAPLLKAGLLGALVSGLVGMLVNDSGAAVLSMALALAVPLVLSAGIRAVQLGEQPAAPAMTPSPQPLRPEAG
ncbi:hypothetical protein ACFHYQ_16660 [Sphaerimonospora cavernae]|uniref:Uncharacterized protein n=1 Tax=Sphaerimonospora cavernae TaxID=1740611 RepID=A0ABV6U8W7_9ACTN